jgi:hypothetical protein
MKPSALGWLAIAAIMGCGVDLPSGQATSGLTGDEGEKGDKGGSGGSAAGTAPCEIEQLTFKQCSGEKGSCLDELKAMNACFAALPPPAPIPCEAEIIAVKQCAGTSSKQCEEAISALDACRQSKPGGGGGCSSGGGQLPPDKCLPIMEQFKACSGKAPAVDCLPLLEQFNQCEASQAAPPAPEKP